MVSAKGNKLRNDLTDPASTDGREPLFNAVYQAAQANAINLKSL